MNKVHVYFGESEKHPIIMNYFLSGFCDKIIDLPCRRKKSRLFCLIELAYRVFFSKKLLGKEIYHCHDILSFYIVRFIHPFSKIIFDSHEVYRSYFKGVSHYFIYFLEEFTAFFATIKVYPSYERSSLYFFKGNFVVIENLFFVDSCGSVTPPDNSSSVGNFVYAGLLSSNRYIKELIAAFKKIPEFHLDIYGLETFYFKDLLSRGLPHNVEYRGQLRHDLMLNTLVSYDASFALYRKVDLNNKYPAPTKIFENEYYGISTICFSSPYIERLVKDGILKRVYLVNSVDAGSIEGVASFILKNRYSLNNTKCSDKILWQSQINTIQGLYVSAGC